MNLYVSNLGFHVNDEDLTALFATYGNVTSAKVIKDKFTGKSRGFGFVDMPQDDAAEKAIKGLEGKEVEGRAISVSVAKPRADRGSSFSGSRW
jgi:RNA recognition motif-containing protein